MSIHHTLYITHYTLYVIHCTLCIIHYTIYIIHLPCSIRCRPLGPLVQWLQVPWSSAERRNQPQSKETIAESSGVQTWGVPLGGAPTGWARAGDATGDVSRYPQSPIAWGDHRCLLLFSTGHCSLYCFMGNINIENYALYKICIIQECISCYTRYTFYIIHYTRNITHVYTLYFIHYSVQFKCIMCNV